MDMNSGNAMARPLSRSRTLTQHARPVTRVTHTTVVWFAALVAGGALAGCSGRASILPNPDPALRKTSTQFAADAAKCFPYPADAPRGGDAGARAEVDYDLRAVHLSNLSGQEWHDAQVWVDGKYVVLLKRVPPSTGSKPTFENLNFQLLFDDAGNHYPTFEPHIKKFESFRAGNRSKFRINRPNEAG